MCWQTPSSVALRRFIAGRIVVVTAAGMCVCEPSLVLHQSVFD